MSEITLNVLYTIAGIIIIIIVVSSIFVIRNSFLAYLFRKKQTIWNAGKYRSNIKTNKEKT